MAASAGPSESLPSPSLEQCSGLVFTSRLIDILCDEHSPLLQKDKAVDFSKCRRSMEPTLLIRSRVGAAYDDFCRAVEDVCIWRSDKMAKSSNFHFTPADFESEASWADRGFDAMVKYDEKRSQRENYRQECQFGHLYKAHDSKAHLEERPETWALLGPTDLSSTIGIPVFSKVNALRSVVTQFFEVCPGIWAKGESGIFRAITRVAMNQPDAEISDENLCTLVRAINWRNEQLNWADNIVQLLQLSLPYEQTVRTWYAQLWETKHQHCSERYRQAQLALTRAKIFEIPEMRSRHEEYGCTWYRTQKYVAAAVALSSTNQWEVSVRICQIVELHDTLVRGLVEDVIREPRVQATAEEFFRQMGKLEQ
jgi:hypothetical protein